MSTKSTLRAAGHSPEPLVAGPMSRAEAETITAQINAAAGRLCVLLLQAHERQAWRAMGYNNWREYAAAELRISQAHAYRILDHGRVTRALIEAVFPDAENSPMGEKPDVAVSEREARDVKPVLSAVTQEVRARIAAGELPHEVVPDVIRTHRSNPDHRPKRGQLRESVPFDSVPESDADTPDPISEWKRAEEELGRARELIEVLQADDTTAELAKLHEKYGRLEGRLRHEMVTRGEAERTAKYATGQLRKIRTELGVKADRDIIPAIRSLK